MDNIIGKELKLLREKKGLSLRELGDEIGVDFSHLSRVERGIKSPSIELLTTLANYFNVHISHFFGEQKEVPKELEGKVEWIAFANEMEDRNLTPERIKEILEFAEHIKKMSNKLEK